MLILYIIMNISYGKDVISFSKAKTILKSIYGTKNVTFYCNCPYQKNSIELKKCKTFTQKFKKRNKRIEWEHIVPAHAFGKSFKEWREAESICGFKTKSNGKKKKISPRKCARKN